jgi:hypothetical protein
LTTYHTCYTLARTALLIELGGSHDETLYTQLRFLKHAGYYTILACDPKVFKKVRDYDCVDLLWECRVGRGFLSDWKAILDLRSQAIEAGVTAVIFNTAQNELVRNLCLLPFPKTVRIAGVLHNLRKLEGSFTQRVISRRIKHYYLLAHYLKDLVPARVRKNFWFEAFYPMYFKKYESLPATSKPADEVWVGIPGAVEYSRRDYEGIARALAQLEHKPNICFLLLGNAFHPQGNGPQFSALIKELGVENHFRLWNHYVDNPEFHAYVQSCDALMMAIHPANADYEDYIKRQITGAWNLAFAYQKPLLLEAGFSKLKDFIDTGIFYSIAELPAFLQKLPELLSSQPNEPFLGPDWSFEVQAKRYTQFLEG